MSEFIPAGGGGTATDTESAMRARVTELEAICVSLQQQARLHYEARMTQIYIDGTAPQPATGPWTAELDALESGTYLVENEYGELGIYGYSGTDEYPDEDPVWIDAITTEPADPPRRVARIYR